MATLYVSPSGSDSNTGSSGSPLLTLTQANLVAQSGDTVHVRAGTYVEQVTLRTPNVTWIGETDGSGNLTSHINGNRTLQYGFRSLGSATGVTIDTLDIYGQTIGAVSLFGPSQGVDTNTIVQNCELHHVYGTTAHQYGVQAQYGNGQVLNCRIHHIGLTNESWGIFSYLTHSFLIDGCQIWMCRKGGIRGALDKDSIRRNNRSFLNWIGVEDSASLSSLTYNNFLYLNQYGFIAKHSNSNAATVPTGTCPYVAWGIDPATIVPYSRWYHNTCVDNYGSSWVLMAPDPGGRARLVDVRNNIFGVGGGEYLYNQQPTGQDLSTFIVDNNLWSTVSPTPHYDYREGFSYQNASTSLTLAGLQSKYGFDVHSTKADPALNDMGANADYDYQNTSPAFNAGASGANFPLGQQMGARGVAAPAAKWTKVPMQTVSSLAEINHTIYPASNFYDMIADSSYQMPPANAWVIGSTQSGSPATFNHFYVVVAAHGADYNPRQILVEGTNDATNGPWTTLVATTNPDSLGASIKYQLSQDFTYRYIRYTAVSNFGNATYTQSDGMFVGELVGGNVVVPPAQTLPDPPVVTALAGNAQIAVSVAQPVNLGSGTLTGFDVSVQPGNIQVHLAAAGTTVVTGLTNGNTYSVSATVTTTAGTSVTSVALHVTPFVVPPPPPPPPPAAGIAGRGRLRGKHVS